MTQHTITDGMIQREIHYIAKWLGIVDHLILGKDIEITLPRAVNWPHGINAIVKYKGDTISINIKPDELLWSLDDVSERIILPPLTRLADRHGHATWD